MVFLHLVWLLVLIVGVEYRGVALAETAADLGGGHAPCGGDEQKPDASVNRKDAVAVVEPDERIDAASREQQPAKRSAPVVAGQPCRQHEADPSARPRQRDRPLDEELIPIGVAVRLRGVDPAVARAPDDSGDVALSGDGAAWRVDRAVS